MNNLLSAIPYFLCYSRYWRGCWWQRRQQILLPLLLLLKSKHRSNLLPLLLLLPSKQRSKSAIIAQLAPAIAAQVQVSFACLFWLPSLYRRLLLQTLRLCGSQRRARRLPRLSLASRLPSLKNISCPLKLVKFVRLRCTVAKHCVGCCIWRLKNNLTFALVIAVWTNLSKHHREATPQNARVNWISIAIIRIRSLCDVTEIVQNLSCFCMRFSAAGESWAGWNVNVPPNMIAGVSSSFPAIRPSVHS